MSEVAPKRRSKRKIAGRGGVVVVVLLILVVYIGSIIRFAEAGQSQVPDGGEAVESGVNFGFDLVNMDPAKNQMTLRTLVVPAGDYLNEDDGTFAKAIRVTARYQTGGSVTRDIAVGTPVGSAVDYNLFVDGNPLTYPFDQYRYALPAADATDPNDAPLVRPAPLVSVDELGADKKPTGEVVPLGVFNPGGLQGWTEVWQFSQDGDALYMDLTVKRAGGVLAFAIVVLSLMVAAAVLAGMVAMAVARKRRPIEATMAGWFAALLFALVPLRINLPGAPPIGAWMDVAVFYWVEISLLVAMAVFIGSWLKYRKRPVE